MGGQKNNQIGSQPEMQTMFEVKMKLSEGSRDLKLKKKPECSLWECLKLFLICFFRLKPFFVLSIIYIWALNLPV